MPAMSKHVTGSHSLQLIPLPAQILQISCERCRITAYIHNLLRLHLNHGAKQLLVTALPRRINCHHICPQCAATLLVLLRHNILSGAHEEFRIGKAVTPRIVSGILDCMWDDLETADLGCLLCKKQRDRSDAAVQIPHDFVPVKICVFECSCVKLACLLRIYLIKGQW